MGVKKIKNGSNIPQCVVKRLPQYYRFLGDLLDEGITRISSKELSVRMGLTASQIRQDLSRFGEFGRFGYGYSAESLRKSIGDIIGVENLNRVIIVGAGNVGQAICDDVSFEQRGCVLSGIFDRDENLHGKVMKGKGGGLYEIKGMGELPRFCEENQPNIVALCVPKTSAKSVCELLIGLGQKNFWNFTHFDINLHFDDVNVENVHLGDSLLTLVYKLNTKSVW